ncbi:MAG: M23 family metallopeptidase [Patescibacteria group bacterium]
MADEKQESSNEIKRWCLWCSICSCLMLLLSLALMLLPLGAIFYFLNIKNQDKLDNLRSGGSTAEADLTYPENAPSTEEIGNCIDEYIKSQVGETGLYGHGVDIATAGQVQDVNPGFIVAIGQAESALGTNITSGNYNYWNRLPPYDFASWEDSINQHAGNLASYISAGQNTIVKIGNGAKGTYIPKTSEKYAPNDCDKAVVDPPAYCPCGYAPDGIGYGTSTDFIHDPHKVNQYWIPNVTKFFDQVAAMCNYLAPPTPGQAEWCWPTNTKSINPTGHFRDPNYSFNKTDPATGETIYTHEGIDIVPATGNTDEYAVKATKSGTVTKVVSNCADGDQTCNNGSGNEIVIDHGNNQVSKYWHLSPNSTFPTTGQQVTKGDQIATINNTGFSFGDHLHFEIWFGDVPQNPETLLGDCTDGSACRETILQVAKEKAGMYLNVGFSCCAGFTSTVLEEAKNRGASIDPDFYYTNWAPNFADNCPSQQETCDPDGQNWGTRIDNINDILPGDIILFHRTYYDATGSTYTHVGIMGEDGVFYDCSGSQSRVNYLSSWHIEKFAEGRRICED